MRRRSFIVLATMLFLSSPAHAWDAAGHMITAGIAYRQLSPEARKDVDELLSHHPEATSWEDDRQQAGSPLDPGQYRFLRASTWPDEIKRKPGWPNHASWHFADYPLRGPDAPPSPDPAHHDILVGLAQSEQLVMDSGAASEDRAVALAYVIHLIGDLHQPLHCATAVTALHPGPKGDAGGNETHVRIDSRRTVVLHALWDDLLGKSRRPAEAWHEALQLPAQRSDVKISSDGSEEDWSFESRRLAQTVAYPGQVWTATGDGPLPVDDDYLQRANATAERQMLVGGARLAVVLTRITSRQFPWRVILLAALAITGGLWGISRRGRRRAGVRSFR